jgi:hypothetical protein
VEEGNKGKDEDHNKEEEHENNEKEQEQKEKKSDWWRVATSLGIHFASSRVMWM